jgi:hypothetical protein
MKSTSACVIVMGPYRSGTSLSAQILSALGVDFGSPDAFQLAADRYNPGGYFQRRDVVEANVGLIGAASEGVASPVEPEAILEAASPTWCADVDLTWTANSPLYGLKDPRFCATLLTWIASGTVSGENLRIVRVVRDIDAIARSSVAHREVGSFCDYDLARAVDMARVYDARAGWHIAELSLPAIEVRYERLLSDPPRVVSELAEFVGQSDPRAIRRARLAVGKGRALARHYSNKLAHPSLALATARKTLRMWLRM